MSDWLDVFRAWIDSAENQRCEIELSPAFARRLLERLEAVEDFRTALRIEPSAGFAGRLLDRMEAAQQLTILLPTLLGSTHLHLGHPGTADHCSEEPCPTARALQHRLTR